MTIPRDGLACSDGVICINGTPIAEDEGVAKELEKWFYVVQKFRFTSVQAPQHLLLQGQPHRLADWTGHTGAEGGWTTTTLHCFAHEAPTV